MKKRYFLPLLQAACFVLLSLLLQNCSGLHNPPIPTLEEQPASVQTTTQAIIPQADIQPLIDKQEIDQMDKKQKKMVKKNDKGKEKLRDGEEADEDKETMQQNAVRYITERISSFSLQKIQAKERRKAQEDSRSNDVVSELISNPNTELVELRLQAENNDQTAQYKLAEICYKDKNYQEAKKWYKESTKTFYDSESEYKLGLIYEQENKWKKAKKRFKNATLGLDRDTINNYENFYADAQYRLGLIYERDTTNHKNFWLEIADSYEQAFREANEETLREKAKTKLDNIIQNLKAAIENKDVEASYRLGVFYIDGIGVNTNYTKAIIHFENALKQKHLDAKNKLKEAEHKALQELKAKDKYNLGIIYELGNKTSRNYDKAVEWYKKSAVQGCTMAEVRLARMYYNGWGLNKNQTKARNICDKERVKQAIRVAANNGDVDCQFILGWMFWSGCGMEEDKETSFKWVMKAANKEHVNAQFSLGMMYDNGLGVEKDEVKAIEWFQKAANQGLANAQLNLGVMYEYGQGIIKDEVKAIEWFQKAANQGNAEAQYRLGYIYYCAQGVEKDYITSIKWFQEAAKNGGEYNFNEILDTIILELAEKCLDRNTRNETKKAFDILLKALKEETIDLSIKILQNIHKSLYNFWKKDHPNREGVGIIRDFIKNLKAHIPRKRDYHSDSEGESDSEDTGIVYRALALNEDLTKGLTPKGSNPHFSIINHVSPLRGKTERETQSLWISTTRSLKVAAAWASESLCKSVAKIRIDQAWRTEKCDHNESGKKRLYDFTQPEDCSLIFGNSTNTERNTVIASQEVTIYRGVPKENILTLYTADTLSEEEYKKLKDVPKEELVNRGIYSTVKTRKLKGSVPLPRILRIKVMEEVEGQQQAVESMEEEIAELAENLSQTLQVGQKTTDSKDKGKEKDEEGYSRSEVGPSGELYSQEGSELDPLEKKVLQLTRHAMEERISKEDIVEAALSNSNTNVSYGQEIEDLKENTLNPIESEILQAIRQIKQEAVIKSMNCLILKAAPNGELIVRTIQEALEGKSNTLDFGNTKLKEQDFVLLAHHPFFKGMCKELKFDNLSEPMSYLEIGALAKALQITNVEEVDLSENNLEGRYIVEFARNLKSSKVTSIYLSNNNMGAAEAGEFAECLQGTDVQVIDLSFNNIRNTGAVNFIQSLQATNVHTINLRGNHIKNIEEEDIVKLNKSLKTNQVHILDLSRNNIDDRGAIEFDKAVQGTNVEEVDLRENEIGPDAQRLLVEQYPHIKWTF
jgi:TPR repeat protein